MLVDWRQLHLKNGVQCANRARPVDGVQWMESREVAKLAADSSGIMSLLATMWLLSAVMLALAAGESDGLALMSGKSICALGQRSLALQIRRLRVAECEPRVAAVVVGGSGAERGRGPSSSSPSEPKMAPDRKSVV